MGAHPRAGIASLSRRGGGPPGPSGTGNRQAWQRAPRAVPPRPAARHSGLGAALDRRYGRRARLLAAHHLEQVRHLTAAGLSAYMGIQVIGGFVGCVSAGYLLDALGRRRGLALFALGSALSGAYLVLPLDAAWLVFAIGFPLGFFGSGIFSGLAVYLAELYPTELRGAGQGFGYNIVRGIGAVGPTAIGVVAARVGLSEALALAAASYGLCLIALPLLPETRGRPLSD